MTFPSVRSSRINRLMERDLVRHNAVFFTGTLFISIFNYLYYPVIGRLVSVGDFGQVQAIISLFMQLGIVLTVFGYVVTNITNNTSNKKRSAELIVGLERITLVVCVVLFAFLSASSLVLKNSLKFNSALPLVLLGVLIVLNVPTTSRMYLLQGQKRLREVSVAGIVFAAGKLVISVALVFAGFRVAGVVLGYIIALLLTMLYLAPKTRGVLPVDISTMRSNRTSQMNKRELKDELIYGLAILVLLSGVTLLYSSDTIVVRFFFSSVESGLYSAISSVARIVFFVTASVAGVLIATVKMREPYQKNLSNLYRSLGLITIVGGVVAAVFACLPTLSVRALFGSEYIGKAGLLPVLSLVMLFCSYNNLLVAYEIALRRFKAIYIVAIGVALGGAAVLLFHKSILQIVLGYLAANVFIFVLLFMHIVKRKIDV